VPRRPADRLLEWFRSEQRGLPWRGGFPRDPYLVLVSEVMLQQTKVERVVPAFLRFMTSFPTIERLASAAEAEVLRAFAGLGYYRRAFDLLGAARAIVALGGWPRERHELARLPGVGPYTSAAVASFAFAGKHPPVDGNISRVAARISRVEERQGSGALRRAGEALALKLYADRPTPEVWEALMELGASICTPRAPRCRSCPLVSDCEAFAAGQSELFPLARRARPIEKHTWVALWIEDGARRVLLRHVSSGSLLRGLWLPPLAPVRSEQTAEQTAHALALEFGCGPSLRALSGIVHTITHRRIQILPYLVTALPRVAEGDPDVVWADPLAPGVATSTLVGKIARARESVGGEQPRSPASEEQ